MERGGDPDGLRSAVKQMIYTVALLGPIPTLSHTIRKIGNLLSPFLPSTKSPIVLLREKAIEQAKFYQRKAGVGKLVEDKSDSFIAKLSGLQAAGKIDFENVVDSARLNINAGADTTGAALSACVWFIYHHPEKLARLRAEIDELADDPVSFERAQEMPYLNAVLKESLRLHPPVGMVFPRTVPEGGAHLGGYWFTADVSLQGTCTGCLI